MWFMRSPNYILQEIERGLLWWKDIQELLTIIQRGLEIFPYHKDLQLRLNHLKELQRQWEYTWLLWNKYDILERKYLKIQKENPNHNWIEELLKKIHSYKEIWWDDADIRFSHIKRVALPLLWYADYEMIEHEYHKLSNNFPNHTGIQEGLKKFLERKKLRNDWEKLSYTKVSFFENYIDYLRVVYTKISKMFSKRKRWLQLNTSGQQASDMIQAAILSPSPCMIARLGSVEVNYIAEYYIGQSPLRYIRYIQWKIDAFKNTEIERYCSYHNAGIFPSTRATLQIFYDRVVCDMKELDILWSHQDNEDVFQKQLVHATIIPMKDFEPYYHKDPWTQALKGKKVLVIHPFVESIKKQYKNRKNLFHDRNILPDFTLLTYKPVVSFAWESVSFSYWLEALEYMEKDIKKIDFDIAIIGCWAYGFSLASYIKRIGKKSIHMWWVTQILFGIKWKRWENQDFVSSLFNEHWIYPWTSEIPRDYKNIENGCYWG